MNEAEEEEEEEEEEIIARNATKRISMSDSSVDLGDEIAEMFLTPKRFVLYPYFL